MGKIAFVFAGQGAQKVGMGKDLYDHFAEAKEIFDLAGDQVKEACFNGPESELNKTQNTQPCLFAIEIAIAKMLNQQGVFADGVAGFSFGEIPALTYTGILSAEQAFRLTTVRAEAMQACAEANKGTMYAVLRLVRNDVEKACSEIEGAYPVNYNCPGQIVVACAESAEERLLSRVAELGGKTIKLAVSGAFHSPFMEKAGRVLEDHLATETFGEMSVPLYANVTAKVYDDPLRLISAQVKSPVMWQDTIEHMIADGFDTFIEVGPGKTLAGLIKKINGDVQVLNVYDLQSLGETVSEVKGA